MRNRCKRVLWLLNHRTLMAYEVKLLLHLGFEVFTPKIIPKIPFFRSSVADFTYDSSLTIPSAALTRLNNFNFYEDKWPLDIVTIINRYFGTVYTIPYSLQFREVVRKFEGQVLFRVFGLDNTTTYYQALQELFDSEINAEIYAVGNRFWFAKGYNELTEVEPPLLTQRVLYLPLGVPDSFLTNGNSYVGTDNRILFLCPNCVSDPYYSAVYKKFKLEFGDLPHVIIGAQDVLVNDPNVLGFITNEDLLRLYRECAVLYYPSTELRHVHYSPVEAAICGMPVVYYAESLLGRMTPEVKLGRSLSQQEARLSLERILSGDRDYIAAIRTEQQAIPHKFSDEYCVSTWKENLSSSGYQEVLTKEARKSFIWREIKRVLLKPIAKGLVTIPQALLPLPPSHLVLKNVDRRESTIEEGIDFSNPEYPEFVYSIKGLSNAEPGGRWSIKSLILIKFIKPLPKQFKLIINGGCFGPNIGKPIEIQIGKKSQFFTLWDEPGLCQEINLKYSLWRSASLMKIKVPQPVIPANDTRPIGLCLSHLQIKPKNSSQDRGLDFSNEDGIDFSKPDYPEYVYDITGLSGNEQGGRWSIGSLVSIEFIKPLPKKFKLVMRIVGYGPNVGIPIKIQIGGKIQFFTINALSQEINLKYALWRPSSLIQITVPKPVIPPNDSRSIGLCLSHLKIKPKNSSQDKLDFSKEDGIDFSKPDYPEYVYDITGLSGNEEEGRWSIGSLVSIEFIKALPKKFKLMMRVSGYGPNIGVLIKIQIGRKIQFFTVSELSQEINLKYTLWRPASLIKITVPQPVIPLNDTRQVGLYLSHLKIKPLNNKSIRTRKRLFLAVLMRKMNLKIRFFEGLISKKQKR